MSNCTSCKKTKSDIYYESIDSVTENKDKKEGIFKKIWIYFVKFLIFLFLCVIILPIIIPVTIYALAVTVISNKGINLVPLMVYLGKRLYKDDDDDDDDEDGDFDNDEEYDDLSEEEYELDNPHEVITLN